MAAFGDLSRIGENIQAQQALHSLNLINKSLETRQLRFTNGKSINSAEDTAARFLISRTLLPRSRGSSAARGELAALNL